MVCRSFRGLDECGGQARLAGGRAASGNIISAGTRRSPRPERRVRDMRDVLKDAFGSLNVPSVPFRTWLTSRTGLSRHETTVHLRTRLCRGRGSPWGTEGTFARGGPDRGVDNPVGMGRGCRWLALGWKSGGRRPAGPVEAEGAEASLVEAGRRRGSRPEASRSPKPKGSTPVWSKPAAREGEASGQPVPPRPEGSTPIWSRLAAGRGRGRRQAGPVEAKRVDAGLVEASRRRRRSQRQTGPAEAEGVKADLVEASRQRERSRRPAGPAGAGLAGAGFGWCWRTAG